MPIQLPNSVSFGTTTFIPFCSWMVQALCHAQEGLADSIPDEVTGIFNWPNPSIRTSALGSTQPLTQVSTSNIYKGKGQPASKADNLTAIYEPTV
jgi:hypothetical protein